jgi:hypothetical protein
MRRVACYNVAARNSGAALFPRLDVWWHFAASSIAAGARGGAIWIEKSNRCSLAIEAHNGTQAVNDLIERRIRRLGAFPLMAPVLPAVGEQDREHQRRIDWDAHFIWLNLSTLAADTAALLARCENSRRAPLTRRPRGSRLAPRRGRGGRLSGRRGRRFRCAAARRPPPPRHAKSAHKAPAGPRG